MNDWHVKDENTLYCYNKTINTFLDDTITRKGCRQVFGEIVEKSGLESKQLEETQQQAWEDEISNLHKQLWNKNLQGRILFEYHIKCLGDRIDVILLLQKHVFSLEYKTGKHVLDEHDAEQAARYGYNLKNFHQLSEHFWVCPFLVGNTKKSDLKTPINPKRNLLLPLKSIKKDEVFDAVNDVVCVCPGDLAGDKPIDFNKWPESNYYPSPDIIASAREIYANSDPYNEKNHPQINATTELIKGIIKASFEKKQRSIVFLSGVPGSGKTGVGLALAFDKYQGMGDIHGTFVSGNGPLIEVLSAALSSDYKHRKKIKGSSGSPEDDLRNPEGGGSCLTPMIMPFFRFKQQFGQTEASCNVVVFDEAERAWGEYTDNKIDKKEGNKIHKSEPDELLDDFHFKNGWGVIVCLVGLGQDIYDKEYGGKVWMDALKGRSNLNVYYSDKMIRNQADYFAFDERSASGPTYHHGPAYDGLFLEKTIRSRKGAQLNAFVECLLANRPEEAKKIKATMPDYRIFVTRKLQDAKDYVREQCDEPAHCGLLASSRALRLKPDGIFVTGQQEFDIKSWFLKQNQYIKSSNALEEVATEFKIQGLELDWSVVCWDADFKRNSSDTDWIRSVFTGKKWTAVSPNKKVKTGDKGTILVNNPRYAHILNAYRVLLTRACCGFVVFVPEPSDKDLARDKKDYEGIYQYLLRCGIERLKVD